MYRIPNLGLDEERKGIHRHTDGLRRLRQYVNLSLCQSQADN